MIGQPQQRARARTKNKDNNKKRSVVAGIELSVMENGGEGGKLVSRARCFQRKATNDFITVRDRVLITAAR